MSKEERARGARPATKEDIQALSDDPNVETVVSAFAIPKETSEVPDFKNTEEAVFAMILNEALTEELEEMGLAGIAIASNGNGVGIALGGTSWHLIKMAAHLIDELVINCSENFDQALELARVFDNAIGDAIRKSAKKFRQEEPLCPNCEQRDHCSIINE